MDARVTILIRIFYNIFCFGKAEMERELKCGREQKRAA